MQRNCYNCAELEWIDGDAGDPSGFTCHKRLDNEFDHKKESELLRRLEDDQYRSTSKKCWVQKPQTPENQFYYVGYRELFEKEGRSGYTENIEEAGKFAYAEVKHMVKYPCADNWPRWFIPCSALDSFKKGKLVPTEMY